MKILQKKFQYLVAIVFFLITNNLTAQNYSWITPNQTYLKMYVAGDGMFRINKVDFTNAGVNPDIIDPRTVKLFNKGTQIPIYFFGEQDGIFNDNDYIDFFGTRNYGGPTNVYTSGNQVAYVQDEYFDMYSDTNTYWIGWGGAYGLRYSDYNNPTSIPYPLDYYYANLHFEKDTFYSLGESYNLDNDFRYFMNDRFLGEGWYWKNLLFNNSFSDTFSTPFKTPTTQTCYIKIFAYPGTANTTIYNEHRIFLKINNNTFTDTLFSDDFNRIDTIVGFPSSYLNQSSVNNFNVRYFPNTSFTDGKMNFDMLEISYPHRFEFENNIVRFNSTISDSSVKLFKIKGYISSNEIKIYDVKNGLRIPDYQVNADTVIFSGKGNGNFEIINKTITQKPFRIKQKQVPDLVSTLNGVDYLVVYNKLFTTQAEQLRSYRNSHDGFRSVKAEIEDIYDIFNYGIENPLAVRNFTRHVYNNWQTPKVKYLCLFGRGSLYPKKLLTTSIYFQNLIPVYGNPQSDGYFGNVSQGYFTYVQQISIGRLPVLTVQEAQDVVNKIMAYDNQVLDTWMKEPILITDGYDTTEQQDEIAKSEDLSNNFIIPPNYSGLPTRIYLNDPSGYVTYNYSDSIIHSINRGGLFINYIGHSGSGYWNYCFQDPNALSNGNLLPLVFSMTCFTGENAKADYRGFGENFTFLPNKGSIGFISTTGWSWSVSGNEFNIYLLKSFSIDSIRRIGDILRKAGTKMDTSLNFPNRNTINSYNLMGDPASQLKSPPYPEFDIENNDFTLTPAFPTIRKNINLKIYPNNLGTNADSCKIRFQLIRNNIVYNNKDTIIYNWGYKKTINNNFKLDSTGVYVMKVFLDYDNWYSQELTTNNIVFIPITLKNVSFVPLKPENNQSINKDTIEFVGLNPQVNYNSNTVKLLLQFDTTINFNSPLNQVLFKNNPNGVATKFKIRFPLFDTNVVYFWRMNAVINLDSCGWSEVRRFSYWNASFSQSIRKNNDKIVKGEQILSNDTLILIDLKKGSQYELSDFNQTGIENDKIVLGKFPGYVYSRSHTVWSWSPSFVTIQNATYYLSNYRSLNLFKVKKLTGKVLEFKNFQVTSTQTSDTIVTFLNTFDTTQYLVVCKCDAIGGGTTLTAAAINKFKQFGSNYVDSVGTFGWYSTWSMVTYLGATGANVHESYVYYPGGGADPDPAIILINPNFIYSSGNTNMNFGPSQAWKNFFWLQDIYPNSSIKFDVFGVNNLGQNVLLAQNLTNNNGVSLDTINSFIYPNLKLVSKLDMDTLQGLSSPALKSTYFSYYPPAELVIDSIALIKPEPIINDGDEVRVSANYYNVGYRNDYGVIGNWFMYDGAGNKVIMKSDTLNSALQIDSMKNSSGKFTIHYFPQPGKKPYGLVTLYFEVKAFGQQNDYYDFNNIAFVNIPMKNAPPDKGNVDVFADGVKLEGGEYVKQKPEIVIKVTNSQNYLLTTTDTTNLRVYINNNYFSLGNRFTNINKNRNVENNGENSSVTFSPDLNDGENQIKIILKLIDGITYDTIKYSINVSNELLVKDLINYPNPMKNSTTFLFTLAGVNHPVASRIKIYTVSGRVVKIINSTVNTGYNQIDWDGRDNEGDYMANGVYFYRLIIDGDVKKESSIQKLVILK